MALIAIWSCLASAKKTTECVLLSASFMNTTAAAADNATQIETVSSCEIDPGKAFHWNTWIRLFKMRQINTMTYSNRSRDLWKQACKGKGAGNRRSYAANVWDIDTATVVIYLSKGASCVPSWGTLLRHSNLGRLFVTHHALSRQVMQCALLSHTRFSFTWEDIEWRCKNHYGED